MYRTIDKISHEMDKTKINFLWTFDKNAREQTQNKNSSIAIQKQKTDNKLIQLVKKDLKVVKILQNLLGDREKFRVFVKTIKFPEETEGRKWQEEQKKQQVEMMKKYWEE